MAGGRDAQETKARGYLTAGKVSAIEVDVEGGTARFEVAGSSETPYDTHFSEGAWVCDCPARVSPCAHVLACMLVCRLRANETPSLARVGRDDQLDELLAMSLAGTEAGRERVEALRADPEVGAELDELFASVVATREPVPETYTEDELAERARLARELDELGL